MTLPAKQNDLTNPPDRPKKPAIAKLPKLKGKQRLWLRNYLDSNNLITFLNRAQSAKAAKYKANSYEGFCQIGYENYIKLEPHIKQWLDEHGLSENRLKLKLVSLIETKKTVFQKVKGHIDSGKLSDNVVKIAETHIKAWKGKGEAAEAYDDGETVLGISVADPEVQRKSLDMAFKVKGLYKDGDTSGVRPVFNINFFPGQPGSPDQEPVIIDVTPAPVAPEDEFADI